MLIKDKFILLKNTPNTLSLNMSTINKYLVNDGPRKIQVDLVRMKITHFTRDKVLNFISDLKTKKLIHVVNMTNYSLPVSYNIKTDGIVINLNFFGVDDIYPNKPGAANLYACMVYAIAFRELVKKKVHITKKYTPIISSYLTSILIRLFGKAYGLLGSFSEEIPKLKFLVNCYVLESFFGIKSPACFKEASGYSAFNYKDIEEDLKGRSFSNIDDLIISLDELRVTPGLNKYIFADKSLRMFRDFNTLPIFEDPSRFISILTTSSISGASVVPGYLHKYDEASFNSILEIARHIFGR